MVRATLESLAYQCNDLLKAMASDMGSELVALKVDGGACANNFLMQFQSDVLGKEVLRPECIETTSLGAAYLAGLAVGYWESLEDVRENWQIDKTFKAEMEPDKRSELLVGWDKAVSRTLGWAKE